VNVGDLVRLTDKTSFIAEQEDRSVGTVLKFGTYRGLNSDFGAEQIVEILWNTGTVSWILANRIEVISDR
jgi:hypothetical protein